MSKKYHVTTTVNGDECEFLCEGQQTLSMSCAMS